MLNENALEAFAIRTVVDNWVLWRDAGEWERFRTVWHDDGYRMATAYLQSNMGDKMKTDMPGLKGPEVEALYARGKRWLAGGPIER